MRSLGALAFVVLSIVAASCLASLMGPAADDGVPQVARISGSETDPVAVIEPLPETVANGTRCLLDALSSYDPTNDLTGTLDTITNYTWEITVSGSTVVIEDPYEGFTFEELGLYTIMLTVVDDWGNEGVAFASVMCLEDADLDGLPDWWELHYFDSADGDGSDDSDSDGFTDLQEWALGTDPSLSDQEEGPGILEGNWVYLTAVAAALLATVALVVYRRHRVRRKELEAKKIEFAIEIEKSLGDE